MDLHAAMAGESALLEPDEDTLELMSRLVQQDLEDNITEMTVTVPGAPSPAPLGHDFA